MLITVEDNGIGVAAEDQSVIFDRFHQVQETERMRPQGTGLGLAISRQIVDRHGGRIEMRSAPGEGTCCAIHLPAARAPETGTGS